MPEISDEQFNLLKGAYDLLSKLEKSKDTARSFHSLVKKVSPDTQVPEDIAAPFVDEVRSEIKEVKDLVTKRFQEDDDDRENRSLNEIWSSLKKKGMTDEAKTEVGKLMKDRKIADPEAAFALYREMNPPAPTLPNMIDSRWGNQSIRGAGESDKLLFEDPDAWARQEASKVIEEFKTNRAA